MKNLHFAQWGMVILMAVLCAYGSCSPGEIDSDEQIENEYALTGSKDETGAEEDTPVTKDPPGGKPPDGEPPQGPDESDGADEPDEFDELEPVLPGETGDEEPLEPALPGEEEDDNEPPKPFLPEDHWLFDPPEDSLINPSLLINELRTEYSGSGGKVEFIELKMLSQGNLGGLRVFIASNAQSPLVYQFKSVNVNEGEYAVLHLRMLDETCKDEYGDKLNESGGVDSSPTARDFWAPGTSKLLRKTDAVYIMDKNGVILDAVIIAEDTIPKNSAAFFNKACDYLFSKDAWKSASGGHPGHADAVKSSNIGGALTRSVSRDESAGDTNTAADFYVTATGGMSAGKKNDPRRF